MQPKILIKRIYLGTAYTIGHLYVDGEKICDTLEDCVRPLPKACPDTPRNQKCRCPEKIYAQTAIPAGSYSLIYSYSPKFRRQMLRIIRVPHFLGILIHAGNTAANSAGCILVGKNTERGRLTESSRMLARLEEILSPHLRFGRRLLITIENSPRSVV